MGKINNISTRKISFMNKVKYVSTGLKLRIGLIPSSLWNVNLINLFSHA